MTESKVSRQGKLMRQAIAALTRENLIGQIRSLSWRIARQSCSNLRSRTMRK